MSASQSSPGSPQAAPERRIAERTDVRNVLKALQHALRAMRQYGQSSPATTRAVGALRDSFGAVWKTRRVLIVYFQDEGIWAETGSGTSAVHVELGRNEAALQGIRDGGFHSLTFLPGFENEELPLFLDLCNQEPAADDLEDLATSLWFEGLEFLRFTCNDVLADLDTIDAGSQPRGDAPVDNNVGAPDDPPPIPEALLTRPLTLHELQLSGQEVNHLQELIAEESRRPVCADALNALMDSLQEEGEPLRNEILSQLDSLLPMLLKHGFLDEIGTMLLELRALVEIHQDLSPAFCTAIQRTLSLFERSTVVTQYLKDLESGEIVPDLDALEKFTRCLGNANVKTLVRMAERARGKPIASIFRAACESAVERDPDLLLDLLRSHEAIVVRGALSLITATRSDDAIREVILLLRHRKADMRLSAAKSLLHVGRKDVLQALTRSLDDENEDVRQTCAWALATWDYKPAFEVILSLLESPRMTGMVLSEMLTYFDAFARLGGQRAIPYLDEYLNARHLFRPRYETDMRACAARGLGQVRGFEARQALEQAIDDRDPKVKRVVTRQLREVKT